MSLIRARRAIERTLTCAVLVLCLARLWSLELPAAHAEDGAVTVDLVSVPGETDIVPDSTPATVTLRALLHGRLLRQGQVTVRITAPPRSRVLSTDFPHVEETRLLTLTSTLHDGAFTFDYLFPIRGVYTLEIAVAPVPGGTDFRSAYITRSLRITENPAKVRNACFLVLGLFLLGVIAGTSFVRAVERLPQAILPVVLLCGGLAAPGPLAAHEGHGARHGRTGSQVVQGEEGWALEVLTTPEPATVGHLLRLTVGLTRAGEVFSGPTVVSIDVHHLEDAKTVLHAQMAAQEGRVMQSVQLFDGAPHRLTITAHPVGEGSGATTPLTVVRDVDVVALHPPLALKIRLMVILLGVLVSGMVVGLLLPRRVRGTARA